mmetsp:Transcript_24494/g.55273  ORF Transcript_24494/g.55273 Transcript_24494/m.55273 type:complete len:206 (-) Transcript_24494:128-745(-)
MSARGKLPVKEKQKVEERERGFEVRSAPAPLPRYDALRDTNLRQYFESRTVQKYLQKMGWVDKEGKIVDLDKFRGKLNIIEQEFKYAEKTEFWRVKEEEEMRRTHQARRERALEEAKKLERANRIREENRIRRGIISAVKNQSAHELKKQTNDISTDKPKVVESAKGMEERDLYDEDFAPEDEVQEDTDEAGEAGGFFVTQQPGD